MRLLGFSDSHIHPFKMFASYATGDNSRRENTIGVIDKIVLLANDKKRAFDAVVFGGDLGHKKDFIDPVSVAKTKMALSNLEIPFLACSGTHDMAKNGFSTLHAFDTNAGSSRKFDFVFDSDFYITDNSGITWRIILVPYPTGDEAHHKELIETYVNSADDENHNLVYAPKPVLITHGYVSGRGTQNPDWVNNGVDSDWLLSNFSFSMFGHIHTPHIYFGGRILVPGAAIAQNFGDECAGGFAYDIELNLENDNSVNVVVRPIDLENPKFITVNSRDITSIDNRNYYRINSDDKNYNLPEGVSGFVIHENTSTTENNNANVELSLDLSNDVARKDVVHAYADTKERELLGDFILGLGESESQLPDIDERILGIYEDAKI